MIGNRDARTSLSRRALGGTSMHQQVRCLVRKARGDGSLGAFAEASLVEILTLLQGQNLASAGRVRVDGGDDEFVFSVQHVGQDGTDQDACNILTDESYEARVVDVEHFVLNHKQGALLDRIKRLEARLKEPVIEVHILAAEGNGKVPVQFVTRSMLNG
jgi:hypothetical protein